MAAFRRIVATGSRVRTYVANTLVALVLCLATPFAQAPLTPTITVTGGTFVYDGAPHPATASATGTGGAPVAGTFTFIYSPGGASVPIEAGRYSVTATFTSADPSYRSVTQSA